MVSHTQIRAIIKRRTRTEQLKSDIIDLVSDFHRFHGYVLVHKDIVTGCAALWSSAELSALAYELSSRLRDLKELNARH